ncbi:glycosyltransferase family 2 protein [Exiguobacterium aurantiacum]|uniref:Glycosyltransferase n=1 Tax=Exiguobacterium aurantiacum TaxID=33987 RepID=A0ABY5FPZ8_9BACL|nr:glycosyltransferase family 2 protein [Exiguobacterium aurantiacum]UTT43516.1 glycosyltransferase [Exiguobacterium aurantiacum]
MKKENIPTLFVFENEKMAKLLQKGKMTVYYSGKNNLVSIIMPTYNCANYILDTILSVQAQSYKDWELIIIDDCSTDKTEEIIKNVIRKESRIKYFKLLSNSGAAVARNEGVKKATGEYIAFIDSDDLWHENKLSVQVNFMKQNESVFSCTSYNKIGENGSDLGKTVVPKKVYYRWDLLKNCPGNSTVIYNASKLGKHFIEPIKKRNDYLMWLKVIRKAEKLDGIQEVLGSHRLRDDSLSSSKMSLIRFHWDIYRKIEHLSLYKSCYLMIYWMTKGISQKLNKF